ncbi:Pantothenate kinase [Aquimixticola soesokkakensis]|uniref:Pantothenate kinase n=1 Tax=Aquimixticola soesokkakensis TaxID=1519096 RepID=A0A1Y5STG3_9RHOB|nr:nucleoside/nucleotide kinase family protein [Aquimixticola soesokkakensis]SLN48147.1 Pantothenate kinase [Aquimixticola soesokkakensis]
MIDSLVARIAALPPRFSGSGLRAGPSEMIRYRIAIAGAPASGKSTLADVLCERLNAQGRRAKVVPMDGFHLDNALLEARGLLARKGAPETFDAGGFARLVRAIGTDPEVFIPLFDRARDLSLNGADVISADTEIAIFEGNYLLFDDENWRELASLWDLSICLDVPERVLRARLVQRWLDHGLSAEAALQRAESNDLPNAARVRAAPLEADITLRMPV